jgi:hypothetical protein
MEQSMSSKSWLEQFEEVRAKAVFSPITNQPLPAPVFGAASATPQAARPEGPEEPPPVSLASVPVRRQKRPSKIALAIAVLSEHPDWTNAEIATRVHCNVKSLSNSKKFKAARNAIKAAGRAALPRGRKGRDGYLEAED